MPLNHARLVATHDPDDAAQKIGEIFCPHALEPQGARRRQFFAIHNSVALDGFSLNAVRYGGDVAIDPGRLEKFYLLQMPLTGHAEIVTGEETVTSAPNKTASLLSPTRSTRMLWWDSCAQLILFIDRHVLESRLSRLLERDIDEIVFSPHVSLDRDQSRMLTSQIDYLRQILEMGGPVSPQTQALIRENLINTLLLGQRHSYSDHLERGETTNILPGAIKRARDYLEQNFDQEDVIDRMVDHAGTGLRTIQIGFRRHFDKTITDVLRDLRLEALRQAILDNPGNKTLCDLMLETGFSHLGRTAAAYKARFGEAPSRTMAGRSR